STAISCFSTLSLHDALPIFLRLLSRRIKSAPALLIASYRDDELDRSHPLRLLLGELPRDESIVRIRLHPLSAAAVAAMAGPAGRSEEHTSELQSPDHLVCRL